MNILVFDTETIDTQKCFCYNLGYAIFDTEQTKIPLIVKDFVIEQIWNNRELFETAYYENKKQKYISAMRGRKTILEKWGYVCGEMIRDIKKFNVNCFYAYNASFDIKVLDFNSEWFKTRNPLNYGETYDIWSYTSQLINMGLADDYIEFCATHNFCSDAGNIANNAESWLKFLDGTDKEEEHTALSDALLEGRILFLCIERGLNLNEHYKLIKCIASPTPKEKELIIVDRNKTEYKFPYFGKTEYKTKNKIVLR